MGNRAYSPSFLPWLLLFVLFFFVKIASAQDAASDLFLKIQQSKREDTTLVNNLVDYAWEIMGKPDDSAREYLQRAVRLSQKIKYPKGEADALNAIGVTLARKDKPDSAIIFYQKALPIRESIGDKRGTAKLYTNLGNAYSAHQKQVDALENFQKSLQILDELKDSSSTRSNLLFNMANLRAEMRDYNGAYLDATASRMFAERNAQPEALANAYNLLGNIRFEMEQYAVAKEWYEKAFDLRKKLEDTLGMASALNNLGNVLAELGKFDASIEAYQQALKYYEIADDPMEQGRMHHNLSSSYRGKEDMDKAFFHIRKAMELRKDTEDHTAWLETQETYADLLYDRGLVEQSLEVVLAWVAKATEWNDLKFLHKGHKDLAKLYAAKGDYQKAYKHRKEYDELRYKLFDDQRVLLMERAESMFGDFQKKNEIERQQRELEAQEAQIKKNQILRNAFLGGAVALGAIALLLFFLNQVRAKANKEMDRLLKNILPESTAAELKAHNKVKPVRYQSVSVLFTDFKGFTSIAEHMEPEELVAELDTCFRLFDEIVERHGLEKIKTIGDAYMCAGGLPKPNQTHAKDAVAAGLEMQEALQKLIEIRRKEGKPIFEMRIGIHSGPVVAGVVGSHKFAYDIWGDTVNTASRMESNSEPGRVNISEDTFQLVKDHFSCSYRGKLAAKNKGEIDMYFVEGKK